MKSEEYKNVAGPAPTTTDAFTAHVRECDECRADPPPLPPIMDLLGTGGADIDPSAMSANALARMGPELARRGAAAFRRPVLAGVLLALVPLPAVLVYDAYILRAVYAVVGSLLSTGLATYVVVSYGAFLLLLISATYAAIPLLLARNTTPRRILPA